MNYTYSSQKTNENFLLFLLKYNVIFYIMSLFIFTSLTTIYYTYLRIILFFSLFLFFLPFLKDIKITSKPLRINLLFLFFILANNLWAFDKSWSIHRTIAIISYFLGAYLIYLIFSNHILDIKYLLHALIISSFILTIFALYEYVFFQELRAAGLVGNPNIYGSNIVFLSFIIYYYYNLKTRNKMINTLLNTFILIAIIVSGSRQTLLMAGVFYVYYLCDLFIDYKLNIKKIIKILLILFLITIIFITFTEIFKNLIFNIYSIQRLLQGPQEASFRERTELIKIGLILFKERPFLGYGLDNFRPAAGVSKYPHNNYIDLLVSLGIVGLFSYYFNYFYLLYFSLKKRIYAKKTFFFIMFIILMIFLNDLFTVSINSTRIFFIIFLLYIEAARTNERWIFSQQET